MKEIIYTKNQPEYLKNLRELVLKEVENQNQLIDMDKIDDFLNSLELEFTQDLLIVNEIGLNKLQSLLRENSFKEAINIDVLGKYIRDLGIVLVNLSSDDFSKNDKIYLESIALHECLHSINPFNNQYLIKNDYTNNISNNSVPRSGFSIKNQGSFLEEGFIQYVTGEFLEQNFDNFEIFDEQTKKLGPNHIASVQINGNNLDFPLKYCYKVGGDFTIHVSTIASMGYTKLIANKQVLHKLALESRKDKSKLKVFIRCLESQFPGMYSKLRILDYSEDSFFEGLKIIESYVG